MTVLSAFERLPRRLPHAWESSEEVASDAGAKSLRWASEGCDCRSAPFRAIAFAPVFSSRSEAIGPRSLDRWALDIRPWASASGMRSRTHRRISALKSSSCCSAPPFGAANRRATGVKGLMPVCRWKLSRLRRLHPDFGQSTNFSRTEEIVWPRARNQFESRTKNIC